MMWHDFEAIPDPVGRRDGVGSMLSRTYHDIGLAAVADALGLETAEFDGDLARSIERGDFYLRPVRPAAGVHLAA